MIYNLYINTKGVETKIDYNFKSLMDVDYTTSKILNKDSLLALVPDIKENSSVYIKNSNGKSYAVIYNNDFLKKYIDEKNRDNFKDDTLRELYNFLETIKDFSISDKRGYLIEPYNQKDLNKYEMKSLALPKVVRNALIRYSDRTILLKRNYGAELQREYDHDDVQGKFYKTIVSNYENLRSLIVWTNNYKKIVDRKKERELNRLKNIKEEITNTPRVMKNGQYIFNGIPMDPKYLDKGKSK